MKSTVILSLLAVAAAANPVVKRQEQTFKINNVTYGGTGCPQGSLTATIEGSKVKVNNHFTAFQKPGGRITERRANCQLNLDVSINAPWNSVKLLTTYKGEITLDENTKGSLQQTYYISGQTDQGKAERSFEGPINTGYYMISHLAIPNNSAKKCESRGAAFNLNTQALVQGDVAKNASGSIYVDFSGSDIEVNVDWAKDC